MDPSRRGFASPVRHRNVAVWPGGVETLRPPERNCRGVHEPPEIQRHLFSLRRDWPLIVAWPAIGVLSLLIGGVARMLAGRDVAWLRLLWSTISWGEWALIVPLIIVVTRRFPIRRGHTSHVAVHVAATLGVWLLHSSMVYLATWAIYGSLVPIEGITFRQDLTFRLPVWLLYDVLVYLTTSAATAAVDLHRNLAARSSRQAQLQARVAEAELELMQMQAQPEFILATLAAARTLATTEPRRCESLVARLADVLRSTLEGLGSERTPVEAELRHARSWLAVDALRTGRAIDVSVDCDAGALAREIPRHLISELISSVVSASPDGRRLAVGIEAAEIGDLFALRLRIEGAGMSPAAGDALQRAGKRLSLCAPDRWSMEVEEESDSVLAVTFDQMRAEEDAPVDAGLTHEGGKFARA